MIDSDALLPRARERLLLLCSLLAQSSSADDAAELTNQIENTALDIGFVFATDLVHLGWLPDQNEAARIEARLGGTMENALAA